MQITTLGGKIPPAFKLPCSKKLTPPLRSARSQQDGVQPLCRLVCTLDSVFTRSLLQPAVEKYTMFCLVTDPGSRLKCDSLESDWRSQMPGSLLDWQNNFEG